MPYQSPISPGRSWYEDTAGPRPEYPALDGDRQCDVVIVGGGFTGLSAAAHLAKAGADVALIDANRFGDGASGRNNHNDLAVVNSDGTDLHKVAFDTVFQDGGDWSPFGPATQAILPSLSQGAHLFEVRARDSAGNIDLSPAKRTF